MPAARHGRRFSANFTDPSFCPFAEELRPLQLHFEGISYTSFYNFSIYFFVRDIGELSPQTSPGWGRGPGSPSGPQPHAEPRCALLPAVRPDPPQELTAHLREGQLHLAWAPPASWPLPKSYFALLYWLQYELPNGTQVTGQAAHTPAAPHPHRPAHSLPTLPKPRPGLSFSTGALLGAVLSDPRGRRRGGLGSCHSQLSPLLPPSTA